MSNQFNDYVINYVNKRGPEQTAIILEALGKKQDFIDAIETDAGKQLLTSVSNKLNALFIKIANVTATDEERIEYKVLVNITCEWARILASYTKQMDILKDPDQKLGA